MNKFAEKIPEHIARLEAENKRLDEDPLDEKIEAKIESLKEKIDEVENDKDREIGELEDEIDELESELAELPAAKERQLTIAENERIIKQLKAQQGAVK